MRELPEVEDDGLPVDEIRSWSLDKHRLVGTYDDLFSTGMKNRWDTLVYLDLYSGPGRGQVADTGQIFETSSMIALKTRDPFDRYIFCDLEPKLVDALQTRVARERPDADVRYHRGDCNELIDEIAGDLPRASKKRTALSLAFLDPRGIGALKFATIKVLSEFFMDFIILLALGMDAHRFQSLYQDESDRTVDEFLGDATWRDRWDDARHRAVPFQRFLAEEFARSMESLGYLDAGRKSMREFRSDQKNLSLYHIAFFSKNERGYAFWKEALKYSKDQQELPFG